ncbi:hypothetical protein D1007_42306 [Hordeum vulgare]|nr:hypothetical protein D1007_42306 [Hordeum vulgare]
MADYCRAHAERRATRVSQTAPVGPASAHRSPSPMVNAAAGPDAQEQQCSSHSATEQTDGRTTTLPLIRASGSALHGRHALSMATELLRYRLAPDHHKDWIQCIEELVAAASDPAVFSFSFRPKPSLADDEEQDVPPPPLQHGSRPEPRQEAGSGDRPREPRARPADEASCRVVPLPRTNARVLPAQPIPRRECAPLEADPLEQ